MAQYNVKYLDFINLFVQEFSKKTELFYPELFNSYFQKDSRSISDEGIVIPVILVFDNFGKFFLEFPKPTAGVIINYILNFYYFYRKRKRYINFFLYKLSFFYSFYENLGFNSISNFYIFKNLLLYLNCKRDFVSLKVQNLYKNTCFTINKNYYFIRSFYRKKLSVCNINFFIFYSVFSLKFKSNLYNLISFFSIKSFHFFSNIFVGTCPDLYNLKKFLNYYLNHLNNSKFQIIGIFCFNNFCSLLFIKNFFFKPCNLLAHFE